MKSLSTCLPETIDKMKKKFFSLQLLICLTLISIFIGGKNNSDKSLTVKYGDAHVHLTAYGEDAIDSLNKYGVSIVRDCGGDIDLLRKWRDEIDNGKRKGPKIYFAGPMVDGRQKLPGRIGVTTPERAREVVDSLAMIGVDFIKTHASISPDCYFTVLQEAKKNNLKVVSHLPQTIPVWIAADSGLSCIEHAAESFLPAPVAAGFVKAQGDSAIFASIEWWRSPAGDSIINHLGKLKIYFTPTLFSYKVWALQGTSEEEIEGRLTVLEFLKELTLKLHKAGVIILAGTDLFNTSWQNEIPGKSLFKEIEILEEAGLTNQEASNASTINLQSWIDHKENR